MAENSYKARSLVFKALAHPTRLFIIDKLSVKECCVCEFVNELKVDFSTVSKHLSVLKNAGLITDDKRGQQVFYKLQMACIKTFNRCIDGFLAHEETENGCFACKNTGENK
jgi:ArsR family transcriptional regulator